MMRGSSWRLLCLLALAACGACCRPGPEDAGNHGSDGPPSILLITFCTMRADHLGAYGAPSSTASPHLDLLAQHGAVFLRHYSQACYSGGSFASLLTGHFCFGHGVWDHPRRLDDRLLTLAEVLQGAGYATAGFVSSSYVSNKFNYHQGFDWFNDDAPDTASPSSDESSFPRARNVSELRLEQALQWLEEHRDHRFLLWYETPVTHYPYMLPRDLQPTEHVRAYEQHRAREQQVAISRVMFDYQSVGFTEAETEAAFAYYRAAVAYADSLAGTLIERLEELGLDQRTVVVAVADHGDALGEHDVYFNHDANLYEPTIRVPLIMRGPGIPATRIDSVTRNIDLLPTLCRLAGVEPGENVAGVDLLPMLRGEPLDLSAFAESRPLKKSRGEHPYYHLQVPGVAGKLRMVRHGRHKLIAFPTGAGMRYELYDLDQDPGELRNLAATRTDTLEQLANQLDRWFAHYAGADTGVLELDADDLASLRALGYID